MGQQNGGGRRNDETHSYLLCLPLLEAVALLGCYQSVRGMRNKMQKKNAPGPDAPSPAGPDHNFILFVWFIGAVVRQLVKTMESVVGIPSSERPFIYQRTVSFFCVA